MFAHPVVFFRKIRSLAYILVVFRKILSLANTAEHDFTPNKYKRIDWQRPLCNIQQTIPTDLSATCPMLKINEPKKINNWIIFGESQIQWLCTLSQALIICSDQITVNFASDPRGKNVSTQTANCMNSG
jgi:hypothetical protein